MHWRRAYPGIENYWRMTGHVEGLTDHAPSPRMKSLFQRRTSPTPNRLRFFRIKTDRKSSVSSDISRHLASGLDQKPSTMAHIDVAEGTSGPRPPGWGYLNFQHTAVSIPARRDCRAKSRPGSKAGFSPGWLGSAIEGRRPQVRGLRSGGSLAMPARPQPPITLNS